MSKPSTRSFLASVIITGLLLLLSASPAVSGLNELLGKNDLDEADRKEAVERIDNIQEKLKLLQDKLRVLERRKAAKEAAQRAEGSSGKISATPVQVNWQPVDETTTVQGEFGLYTYLLFQGELSDTSALGSLEDFILTIETLPENDIPAGLANRFLIPVEKPQSMIKLGRQPYDYKLNEAFLARLGLPGNLAGGPVLVTTKEPLDPYGTGDLPEFLAVSFGRQDAQRSLELAQTWHRQEKDLIGSDNPISVLFWQVIDGAGAIQVTHNQNRTLVTLPSP